MSGERADGGPGGIDEQARFADLARSPGARFDRLLLALAAEFRPVDWSGALDRLDELARPLFGVAELGQARAAERIACALWNDARLRPAAAGVDVVLLDSTLARRSGHPAVLAAVCVEVARRAGVALSLFSSQTGWFAAGEDRTGLVLIDPAHPPGQSAGRGSLCVRRHCAHELTHALLCGLAERPGAVGRADQARREEELSLLLPIDRPPRALVRDVQGDG